MSRKVEGSSVEDLEPAPILLMISMRRLMGADKFVFYNHFNCYAENIRMGKIGSNIKYASQSNLQPWGLYAMITSE